MKWVQVSISISGGTEEEREQLAKTLERQAKALAGQRGLKVQATIDDRQSRRSAPVEEPPSAAVKELIDFMDIVHQPNPDSQPRFAQLFNAVKCEVYPFLRSSSVPDSPAPTHNCGASGYEGDGK